MLIIRKIIFRLSAIYGYFVFKNWPIYLKLNSRIIGSKYIRIGTKFAAGSHFWIAAIDKYNNIKYIPQIKIGTNVSLSDFCHISAINDIQIGDDVLIGSRVHITDHSHGNYSTSGFSDSPDTIPIKRNLYSSGGVKIGNKVWIGDGVIILSGVTIGNGVVIGANSVVTQNIPDNTIAVGSPAKVIKKFNPENSSWVISLDDAKI